MYSELTKVYQAILAALQTGEAAAIATIIEQGGSGPREAGAKMLIYPDGQTVGTIGGGAVEAAAVKAAKEAIAAGRQREIAFEPDATETNPAECGTGTRLLIEVLPPRPALIIVGAGHVGQAVAELGTFVGYRVTVIDRRAELVTPERFPAAAKLQSGDPAALLEAADLDENTYVVIVTPHDSPDESLLLALEDKPVPFVGLMGSRRRSEATFERARAAGASPSFLEQVHTPIGMKIGAETPREIALSILAEIVSVRRRAE